MSDAKVSTVVMEEAEGEDDDDQDEDEVEKADEGAKGHDDATSKTEKRGEKVSSQIWSMTDTAAVRAVGSGLTHEVNHGLDG